MPLNIASKKIQSGASLIEVMIALLILAVGLLGFAAMQTEGLVAGRKAYLASQAQMLAEDMAERIRANSPDLAGVVAYAMTEADSGTDNSCDTTACSTANMRQWDQYKWKLRLASQLPSGNGDVTVNVGANPYATVTITVSYATDRDSSRTNSAAEAAANKSLYTLSTQITPN